MHNLSMDDEIAPVVREIQRISDHWGVSGETAGTVLVLLLVQDLCEQLEDIKHRLRHEN